MSEAVAIQFLRLLVVAFPPLAELLARYLPDDTNESLVVRIREILPSEGASAAAARAIRKSLFVLDDVDDEEEP